MGRGGKAWSEQPFVRCQFAPACEGQPTSGPQACADVGKGLTWIVEEHHPETADGNIELFRPECVGLGVGYHELGVVNSHVRRYSSSSVQHGLRQVGPEGTGSAPRRRDGCGTTSAADVEDAIRRFDRRRVDDGIAKWL